MWASRSASLSDAGALNGVCAYCASGSVPRDLEDRAQAGHRRAHVLGLGEVVVDDERLGRRVGRDDRHLAAALRLEHAGRQREAVRRRAAAAPPARTSPRPCGTARRAPSRPSRVRRKPPHSATLDDSGPPPSVAHSARFSSVSASLRLTGSSNIQVAPKVGWSWRPSPTPGTSATVGHLQQRELVGAPDPRQPEDLRRQVRARRDDDLALGAELEQLAQPRADDADRAGAVEEHAVGVHVGLDREVRAVHDRVQVGDRRAAAPAVARRELVPAEAVLARAVEVLAGRQAARRRGVEEGLRQPGARERVRDAQRPADAVVLGGAAHVVLRAQEVGQHVVPAPAQLGPLVVVGRVAADVDHRVDRRGAAERLAARQVDAAIVETRLVAGAEVPVVLRAEVAPRRRPGCG